MMFARDGPSRIIGRKRANPQSPLQSPLHSPSPSQASSPLPVPSPLQALSPLQVPSPGSSMAPSPHHPHHSYFIKHEPMSPLGQESNLLLLSPNPSPSTSMSSDPSYQLPTSPSTHNTSPYPGGGYNNNNSSSTNGFSSKRIRGISSSNGGVGGGGSASGAGDQGNGGDWPMPSPGTASMDSLSPSHHSMVLSPASTTSTGTCSPSPRPGRDDVSSPNSMLGGFDSSSMGNCSGMSGDSKKKKGMAPRQQEDLCLVCGDRASGYHYNALTCEGCKGFFRRSITKRAVYTCKYGNNCEIDMYMRRKCQECRFKKCISVGMREECVIPEVQCQIKREQKKAREKEKTKDVMSPSADSSSGNMMSPDTPMMSPSNSIVNSNSAMSPPSEQNTQEKTHDAIVNTLKAPMTDVSNTCPTFNSAPKVPSALFRVSGSNGSSSLDSNNDLYSLSNEQAEIINRLLYHQEAFEIPTAENITWYVSKEIEQIPLASIENKCMRISHITEMTIVTVQLIVEFAKRVPGFEGLRQNDQITLLKGCSSEIIMLRAARRYDVTTDSIVFGNNFPYKKEAYIKAGMVPKITDELFKFCSNMSLMSVDNAEYALLTAIVLFSDRSNLIEEEKVERIQEVYVRALRDYTDNKYRAPSGPKFAKLLSILTELRTLGFMNSEQCYTIKNDKFFPEFLRELWDVNKSDNDDEHHSQNLPSSGMHNDNL